MTQLGVTQTLVIKRLTSVGAYLNEEDPKDDAKQTNPSGHADDSTQATKSGHADASDKSRGKAAKGKDDDAQKKADDVLLPNKYLKKDLKKGDRIEVFVYRDSDDRLIATTNAPKIEVGQFAILPVVETTRIGAFLNWGLEKDLFLPFEEQTHKVKSRENVFVYCYVDKSDRLCATMKVKNRFETQVDLQENDNVEALVYTTNPDIGAFVLVDDKYNGLIPRAELKGAVPVGEKIEARISRVMPDGKLDLSLRARSHETISDDADKIYKLLKSNKGFLRVNDKTSPKDIKMLFGMSKSQFKRALGNLYRKELIDIREDGIHAVQGGKHDRNKR